MTIVKSIGKDTIGEGKKMKVAMKSYEMSTHDLSKRKMTTMAPGTLVPIYKLLVLPGDHIKIKIHSSVLTGPANGPHFGAFKLQMDAFCAPLRLYQSMMQNNELEQGLNMEEVSLPTLELSAPNNYPAPTLDSNAHTSPSSVLAQLGIRGIGHATETSPPGRMTRRFHASAWLMYWDTYKNFYANKQEKIGYVIHNTPQTLVIPNTVDVQNSSDVYVEPAQYPATGAVLMSATARMRIIYPDTQDLDAVRPENFDVVIDNIRRNTMEVWTIATKMTGGGLAWWELSGIRSGSAGTMQQWDYTFSTPILPPQLLEFDLKNLDTMRRDILMSEEGVAINQSTISPYGNALEYDPVYYEPSAKFPQEGLAIKTYQSDLFNNWINTEWIEAINEQTSVSTAGGSFTMDSLTFANKLWELQNRIGLAGGSIDDWIDTVWTAGRRRNVITPQFIGGASREVEFQQVISTAATENQPLGQLGGRGITHGGQNGGYIDLKVDEPSYILILASLTPRIVYSQGNDWDNNLLTMDDLHKPQMDGIGFQDLITDQFDWRDTAKVGLDIAQPVFRSIGKQPAWINYTTAVDEAMGNFAVENNQMFMVPNRRYEWTDTPSGTKDKTTYIDPSKFNYIFAETALDAQNFWAEFYFQVTARRKMSARQIPNL